MAKHRRDHPDMIEDFESAAERMAGWIGEHRLVASIALVVALGTAAAFGAYSTWSHRQELAASNALDEVREQYLAALGAAPGALEEPELANPAAADAIREEYVPRFQAVADEHKGTVAGAMALFEVAALLEDLGRPEQTEAVWEQALERAQGNPTLEGLLHQRLAELYEDRGDWAAAAAAHEQAGQIRAYPLRYWALVDAARCYVAAGDRSKALTLYDQVDAEAPDLKLPPHIRAQIRELRALQAS